MTSLPGITQLLSEWNNGDREALDRMLPLVYDELRRMAARRLSGERPDHTLQPTALVHEAILRLLHPDVLSSAHNRAQLFTAAARAKRQVLVDHARRRRATKRGSGEVRLAFDESLGGPASGDVDLILLDDALTDLSRIDERQSRIVELRFFAGLSVEETALVTGVSDRTVKREWASARAWLFRELARGGAA